MQICMSVPSSWDNTRCLVSTDVSKLAKNESFISFSATLLMWEKCKNRSIDASVTAHFIVDCRCDKGRWSLGLNQ